MNIIFDTWECIRIPGEIIELILSYTGNLPYYAGVCKAMHRISMRKYRKWLSLFEREYPCWDIHMSGKRSIKHHRFGLTDEQEFILRFHLNRAALGGDWDAFKYILNPHIEDEYLIGDAHNLCILFKNDYLADQLEKHVIHEDTRKRLYKGRDPNVWQPDSKSSTYYPWKLMYDNILLEYADEIDSMFFSAYCTNEMTNRFRLITTNIGEVYVTGNLYNTTLFMQVFGPGIWVHGNWSASMFLAREIAYQNKIDKRHIKQLASKQDQW